MEDHGGTCLRETINKLKWHISEEWD